MNEFFRAYRAVNVCIFALCIGPFLQSSRFECKTRYLVFNRFVCLFYFCLIVKLNLDNVVEIFRDVSSVALLLRSIQIVSDSFGLLFMILLLVAQREHHADIFNSFHRFDQLHLSYFNRAVSYRHINRSFWIESFSFSLYLISACVLEAHFARTLFPKESVAYDFSDLLAHVGETVIIFHIKNCASNWFERINRVNRLLNALLERKLAARRLEHIVELHRALLKAKSCLQQAFGGTLLFIILYGLLTTTLKLYIAVNSNVHEKQRDQLQLTIVDYLLVEVAVLVRDVYVILHLNRFGDKVKSILSF